MLVFAVSVEEDLSGIRLLRFILPQLLQLAHCHVEALVGSVHKIVNLCVTNVGEVGDVLEVGSG